jgi:uncharacterized protein (TIGR03067 family)
MKTTVVALALVFVSLRGIAADAPKHTDQESIQGIWLAQTESQNGQTRNVDYQYVFRGEHVVFKDESGKEMKYSFTLDTASSPKLLIIRPEESPTDSAPVSVAYELKGDSLTIVVAPSGSRPADISDKNNQELIVCKRKSP